MMRTIFVAVAVALALAVTLPAARATAQTAIRTYVSITGDDTNPCSLTAPCRHFQAAVNLTSLGGEVDALDPGGYGAFTISQAITIEGQGWSYVAPGPSGDAISISAGTGNVVLRGLSLNGVGATGTTNGIVFNAGGSLTVTGCQLDNFTNDGILIPATSANSIISDTYAANNGHDGIEISGSGFQTIVNTFVLNNGNDGIQMSGGASFAEISNTNANNNQNNGFEFHDESVPTLSNVRADGNSRQGIYVSSADRNAYIKNSDNNSFSLVTISTNSAFSDGTNFVQAFTNNTPTKLPLY
jgi:Right handed beta helix region